MTEDIQVLICTNNLDLPGKISSRIRRMIEGASFIFTTSDDGAQALNEFRVTQQALVIIDLDLPSLSGLQLAQEISKLNTNVGIMILGSPHEPAPYPCVELPIINWTNFINVVLSSLPHQVRVRHGLFKRDSVLYDQLIQYASRFRSPMLGAAPPIALISLSEGAGEGPGPKVEKGEIIFRQLSPERQREILKVEGAIIGGLFFITLVYSLFFSSEGDGIFSVRGFLILLTTASVGGFFLARRIDRFITDKP